MRGFSTYCGSTCWSERRSLYSLATKSQSQTRYNGCMNISSRMTLSDVSCVFAKDKAMVVVIFYCVFCCLGIVP